MNFAQQLATDLTNAVAAKASKPAKAAQQPAKPAKARSAARKASPALAPAVSAAAATAAPKAQPKPAPKAQPVTLTDKGAAFMSSNAKDAATWTTIKEYMAAAKGQVTTADLWALVPKHRSYIGYALKNKWLA